MLNVHVYSSGNEENENKNAKPSKVLIKTIEVKKWNSCSCFISLMKCNYNVRKCVGTWTQSYICNTIYKIDQILFLWTANKQWK